MFDEAELADRRSKLSSTKRDLLARMLREADHTAAGTTIPKRDPLKPLPLSFAQQRLLSLQLLSPSSAAYNISRKVTLKGSLNVPALVKAMNEISRRHESLRTSFRVVDGEWLQSIEAAATVRIATIDLTGVREADRENEVARLVREQAQEWFDVAHAPLLRAKLLRLTTSEHVLLFTIHHLISDGWSIDLFFRELKTLYEAFSAGSPSPLPELQIQYGDYSNWQRDNWASSVLDRQVGYWREQLSGAPPALELLTDEPRQSVSSSDGARHTFWITANQTQQLRELAQSQGLSLFMLLLATFKLLLYRYSAQADICVGVPAAQRSPKELEDLIGFLVNTLVIRTQIQSDWTFRQLLENTRDTSLAAFANQDVPFDQIVELSQTKREPGRPPLFQVMFALHSSWFDSWTMAGVECKAEFVYNNTAQFDLSLDLTEAAGALKTSFEYRTDLFHKSTIERMAQHFQVLLQEIITGIDRRLADLPLMSAEERHQLLLQGVGDRTDHLRDKCIHQLFEIQASRTPDAVAVSFGDELLTYRQLDERGNQLARHLQTLGLRAGMPVAMLLDQQVEMAVGILGILKAGGAYLPLDPALPHERLAFLITDSAASLAVTQDRLAEKLCSFDLQKVSLDADWAAIGRESAAPLNTQVDPENLAYIIYTSGSTGRPKGVLVRHRGVVNHALEFAELQKLVPGDRVLQFATISFDTAAEELFPTWFSGATVVTKGNQPPSPADFVRLLREERITVVNLPTAYWHLWVDVLALTGEQLPREVRIVIIGGEKALTERLESWFKCAGDDVRLINGYGPTEATVTTTVIEPSSTSLTSRGNSVPIGRPLKNTRVYVLDGRLEPVPAGVAGELYIGGSGLAHGYLARPDLTAENFIPDPFAAAPGERLYRTGDLVRYLPDTNIEYLGRKDQQVKVRGYRIELGEIEVVLGTHEGVRDVVVVTQEYAAGEHRLIAYFVPANSHLTSAEFRQYATGRLPSYMLPSAFVPLQELPLTPTKKVDRKALSALDLQRQDEAQAGGISQRPDEQISNLPRTDVERKLLDLWEDTLCIKGLGIHDDFFVLGGHSLLAMKLIALAQETFRVELPFRKLFEQPTIATFARTVETALRGGADEVESPIRPISRNGDLPLSFNQEMRLFRDWWDSVRKIESSPFRMQIALRLRGQLRIPELEQAFTEAVRRHEVFRTTFDPPRGLLANKFLHPLIDKLLSLPITKKRLRKVSKKNVWKSSFFKQTVNPPGPFKLRVIDLRGPSREAQEAEVQRLAREEVNEPIDYTRNLLLRAVLLQLADDEHVLLTIVSHLVADGWSVQVLLGELAQNYYAFCNGEPSPLAELPFQYADFAYWQRERLQGKVRDDLVTYWEKRYSNFPLTPHLNLPFAIPRTAPPNYLGGTQILTLTDELYSALKDLARSKRVTLYMVFLSAFITLLARYSGQQRLGLFIVFANRHRLETQSGIGWISNAHVFNTDLSNLDSFTDFLEHVRTTLLEDYAHQEIPYSLLFGELLQRNSNYKVPARIWEGLYAFFDFRVDEEKAFQVPGLTVSPVEIPTRFADDLSMYALESGGVMKVRVNYAADRFEDSRIAQLVTGFEQLLIEIAREPETPLAALTHLDQGVDL